MPQGLRRKLGLHTCMRACRAGQPRATPYSSMWHGASTHMRTCAYFSFWACMAGGNSGLVATCKHSVLFVLRHQHLVKRVACLWPTRHGNLHGFPVGAHHPCHDILQSFAREGKGTIREHAPAVLFLVLFSGLIDAVIREQRAVQVAPLSSGLLRLLPGRYAPGGSGPGWHALNSIGTGEGSSTFVHPGFKPRQATTTLWCAVTAQAQHQGTPRSSQMHQENSTCEKIPTMLPLTVQHPNASLPVGVG